MRGFKIWRPTSQEVAVCVSMSLYMRRPWSASTVSYRSSIRRHLCNTVLGLGGRNVSLIRSKRVEESPTCGQSGRMKKQLGSATRGLEPTAVPVVLDNVGKADREAPVTRTSLGIAPLSSQKRSVHQLCRSTHQL